MKLYSLLARRSFGGLVLLTAGSLISSPAFATLCVPNSGNPNSGFDYFNAVGDTLVNLRQGREEVVEALTHTHEQQFFTIVMAGLKTSQQYFQCAISTISRYESSPNEMTAGGAKLMHASILKLMGGNEFQLNKVRAVMNGTWSQNAAKNADQESDTQVATKDGWTDIAVSAITATWAVLEPAKNEKSAQKLLITSAQRKQLIKKLEVSFGKEKNPKENRVAELSAAELLGFLRQKRDASDTAATK